jgi:pimeloyl-ACP methyl ester carboxylesterase
MTTRPTPLTGKFIKYIEALQEINKKGVSTKKEAETILKSIEPDMSIVHFLLTNLVPFRDLHHTAKEVVKVVSGNSEESLLKVRVNLDAILQSPKEISEVVFDYPEKGRKAPLQSLFIYGTKADYVLEEDRKDILKHFPSAKFSPIDAGHWVHAEKPTEFVSAVKNFLSPLFHT